MKRFLAVLSAISLLLAPALASAQSMQFSPGGGSSVTTGTSGHTVPYLDGSNIFSGATNTFSGTLKGTGGIFDGSSLNTRLENVAGAGGAWAGQGLELIGNVSGVAIIQSVNRTSTLQTEFQITGLPVKLQHNGSTVLTTSASGITVTGTEVVGAATVFNSSGVLQAAAFPALTGDVTTSAGSLATTLSSATVVSKVSAQALAPASIAATGLVSSSGATSGIGYATGAGGTVTQITSRATGVTLNKACGAVTLFSAAGSATWASFTVTDSAVVATDVIIVNQKSGTDKYMLSITNIAAGSFVISSATTGGTTTEQPVFQFCVVKGVNA